MRTFLLLVVSMVTSASFLATVSGEAPVTCPLSVQDTLKERQILYNGILWSNKYHKFEGDQYLFSDLFLPGKLSFNNHNFNSLRLRYDILSDEIMIPRSFDAIVMLNKEMVDSFSLSFEGREYRFVNISSDTPLGSSGYYNVLYKGKSALYAKYTKTLMTVISDKSNGYFDESMHLLLVFDSKVYRISRLRDFLNLVPEEKIKIRSYIRENKLRVTIKDPASFAPVISFYDSLKN
jgi:hypothetical protein